MKATIHLRSSKIYKSEQERSNCQLIVNRQVYFMTMIVKVI